MMLTLDKPTPAAEVRRAIGVAESTFSRWVNSGVRGRRLGVVYIGGRAWVTPEGWNAFLDAPNTAPEAEPSDGSVNEELARLGI